MPSHSARYGQRLPLSPGLALRFADVELRYLGRVDELWEACGRSVRVERFEARAGADAVALEWSPGLGCITPTRFQVAGLEFELELEISERLGLLPDGTLVLWPRFAVPAASGAWVDAADYGALAPLAPGAVVHYPDFSLRRDASGALRAPSPRGEDHLAHRQGRVHRVVARGRHFALACERAGVRVWPLATRDLDAITYGEPADFGLAYVGPVLGNPDGVPPDFYFDLPYPGFTLRFCGGPFGAGQGAIYSLALVQGAIDRANEPLLGLTGPSPEYLGLQPVAETFEAGEPLRFAIGGRAFVLQLVRADEAGPLASGALAVWPDD